MGLGEGAGCINKISSTLSIVQYRYTYQRLMLHKCTAETKSRTIPKKLYSIAVGPMLDEVKFDNRKSDLTSILEGLGMLKSGKITEDEYNKLEESSAPTCDSCSFYVTANTMCCIAEAMGMSMVETALIPAVFADRIRAAEVTGKEIVNLVNKNITAKDIITLDSLKNSIKVLMSTCGSTNGILHILAIAAELGIDSEVIMDIFDLPNDTVPQVAYVIPFSPTLLTYYLKSRKVELDNFHEENL